MWGFGAVEAVVGVDGPADAAGQGGDAALYVAGYGAVGAAEETDLVDGRFA